MSYSPGLFAPMPPMVSALTFGISDIADERTLPAVASSATYEAANRAVYVPILVPATCVVRRLWWANGATVSATYNIDCGVYADGGYKPGPRLISTGSTAQGTASQVQFVDVTHTTLTPGRYWLAIAVSSTNATLFRTTVFPGDANNAVVKFMEASALPLPASATPSESSSTDIWLCGFATTASP